MKSDSKNVRIRRQADQEVIADQGRVADTFWRRFKGLMGVRQFPAGHGLLIVPAKGIHTHFMSMPIDVLYLDREGTIVDMDMGMRPWRIGRVRRQAHQVLELPAGTIASRGLQVGDRLEIDCLPTGTRPSARGAGWCGPGPAAGGTVAGSRG